jgi:hypothetical protein
VLPLVMRVPLMKRKIDKFLLAAYTGFRDRGGEWAPYRHVEHLCGEGLGDATAIAKVARRVPSAMMQPLAGESLYPSPDGKVVLLIAGIARCKNSGGDIANFITAANWLATQAESYDPPSGTSPGRPVTSGQVAEALKLPLSTDPRSIDRLMALLFAEGLITNNGQ